jgi:hypothetical protein
MKMTALCGGLRQLLSSARAHTLQYSPFAGLSRVVFSSWFPLKNLSRAIDLPSICAILASID